LTTLFPDGGIAEYDTGLRSGDPLDFTDITPYTEKLEQHRKKTGLDDAVANFGGKLGKHEVLTTIMDFSFMGGSMGSAAGEKIFRNFERACQERKSLILFAASGGARMQEGLVSLMQMAKTATAVSKLKEAAVPYISVLTHPTPGGVMASFASLGDILIAEPGATIGFAGARVVEETIGRRLPDGFQTSEFLVEHGLVDMVVGRSELRDRLIWLLDFILGSGKTL